jgi:cellobiose-specific phosphotransferase system component IIA
MNQQDYLALRKALSLLHQYVEEDRFDLQRILVDAEDVLRDYENKEELDDQMISTVKWINAQIEQFEENEE